MDNTSRMVALLGAVRKQMNGAVLDTLRYYGADYGLNYGVAIHSLRETARETGRDDDFARFLYRQQVRELRIIALWIAEPCRTTAADFPFWATGIINSEVAEQAAHALLSQIDDIDALLAEWCASENALLAYAALLAASRSVRASVGAVTEGVRSAVGHFPDNRIIALGATAALASVAGEHRERVLLLLDGLDDTPTARLVCDEMSWRMAE